MFVRKKTNRSGTISVVVVSKAHGKFTEVKKFGVAKSEEEADELFRKAQLWLRTHDGQQELDFDDRKGKEVEETERFLGNITNTDLDAERVIAEYHGLWVVERAFRVSKGTLEMRPIAAKTITTIRVRLPENGTYATKTLFLTEKHLAVKPLFDLSDN